MHWGSWEQVAKHRVLYLKFCISSFVYHLSLVFLFVCVAAFLAHNRQYAKGMGSYFVEVISASAHRTTPSGSKAEWQCNKCNWSNFTTRQKCRHCGLLRPGTEASPSFRKSEGVQKGAAPKVPYVLKPAPRVKNQEAVAKAAALEAALAGAREAGGAQGVVSQLENELEVARRASTDTRPLADRLAGCRAYIERAEKRVAESEAIITDAQAALPNCWKIFKIIVRTWKF